MLKRVVVVVSAVLAVVLAGHRYVPALGGFTTVMESLLPWLGLAVPVLLLGAALARSTAAVGAVLAPAAVWGVMFGPALLRTPPGGPSDLAVGTVNVGVRNDASGEAVRAVAEDLDLLAAQELTPGGPAAKQLNRMFEHRYAVSTVGLWSRYPISRERPLDVGMGWVRALRATVRTPQGRRDRVRDAPRLGAAGRDHLQGRLAGAGAQADRPRRQQADPAAGRPQHGHHRPGHARADAAADRRAGGRGRRVRVHLALAGFPVTRPDHILFRGMTATRAEVAPATGSDHRAAVASFRL
ncbi:hypothetical protein ACFSTC_35430 [Nonomuraea ferruginea]